MLIHSPERTHGDEGVHESDLRGERRRRTINDLGALRLILTGDSIIDFPRFTFAGRASVERFLRLNQLDPDNPLDLQHLAELHREALDYLTEELGYGIPPELEGASDIFELFSMASDRRGDLGTVATTTLKVMHILHHISGHDLMFGTSVSEEQLFDRLSGRAFGVFELMRASGIELLEFSGGKKSRRSVTTKLMARRNNLASQIYDKARFSAVVRHHHEIVPALLFLARNLFPASLVVPEQSRNGLVGPDDIAAALQIPPRLAARVWESNEHRTRGETGPNPPNEFSGRTYRCINFVVDMPVRIDDLAPHAAPAIAFVLAEFQVVDERTHAANNEGDNAHTEYKRRQYERVRTRLEAKELDLPFGVTRGPISPEHSS